MSDRERDYYDDIEREALKQKNGLRSSKRNRRGLSDTLRRMPKSEKIYCIGIMFAIVVLLVFIVVLCMGGFNIGAGSGDPFNKPTEAATNTPVPTAPSPTTADVTTAPVTSAPTPTVPVGQITDITPTAPISFQPTPTPYVIDFGIGEVNLTVEQAYKVLCTYDKEKLGLSRSVMEYDAEYDSSLTLVKNLNCYRFNLTEVSGGKTRNRGEFYVAVDGCCVYRLDESSEDFVLVE